MYCIRTKYQQETFITERNQLSGIPRGLVTSSYTVYYVLTNVEELLFDIRIILKLQKGTCVSSLVLLNY